MGRSRSHPAGGDPDRPLALAELFEGRDLRRLDEVGQERRDPRRDCRAVVEVRSDTVELGEPTQSKEAKAQPDGLRAAHLGITCLVEPRALHREGASLERGTNPSVRSLLRTLQIPRWYLHGELSDPEPDLQRDLAAMGVGWKVVPNTGHAMGLQKRVMVGSLVARNRCGVTRWSCRDGRRALDMAPTS